MPIKPVRPIYADSFRCIGSACEDTCCHGWSVPVDRATYEKLQALPPSPLRVLIDESILLAPTGAKSSEGYGTEVFAKIGMNASNRCPLLSSERLCRIHAECGEQLLPHACATYPRLLYTVGGVQEQALAFSCPEAARHALLKPLRLGAVEFPAASPDAAPAPPFFWEIRSAVFNLIRNRTYPLWQRMFLVGILCRRLDAISAGELKRSVPAFLADFQAAALTGRLRKAMEAQPVDRRAQLDAVLRLAGLLLHKSNVLPRFVECIDAFASGIGNGPTATLDTLTESFNLAHDRYFSPFVERHPQILENYLVNTIVRTRFPFGTTGIEAGAQPAMLREFAMLAAQFALAKGLLIGVAGSHRTSFSADHAIHTLQAASKHFDHYPDFPRLAYELLAELRLNGARGMSILLRNADAEAPRPTAPRVRPSVLRAGVSA